jgi:hypothetical protein
MTRINGTLREDVAKTKEDSTIMVKKSKSLSSNRSNSTLFRGKRRSVVAFLMMMVYMLTPVEGRIIRHVAGDRGAEWVNRGINHNQRANPKKNKRREPVANKQVANNDNREKNEEQISGMQIVGDVAVAAVVIGVGVVAADIWVPPQAQQAEPQVPRAPQVQPRVPRAPQAPQAEPPKPQAPQAEPTKPRTRRDRSLKPQAPQAKSDHGYDYDHDRGDDDPNDDDDISPFKNNPKLKPPQKKPLFGTPPFAPSKGGPSGRAIILTQQGKTIAQLDRERELDRQRPLLDRLLERVHGIVFNNRVVMTVRRGVATRTFRIEIDTRARQVFEQYRMTFPWIGAVEPEVGLQRTRDAYYEIIRLAWFNTLYGTQFERNPPLQVNPVWGVDLNFAKLVAKYDPVRGAAHNKNRERLEVLRTFDNEIRDAVIEYLGAHQTP